MQKQTLKSITIGGITVTETAGGDTITLAIGEQFTTLTREDFDKLYEVRLEFFRKETVIKCSVCGNEMTASFELSEGIATVTAEPCQVCARKEPVNK